MTPHDPARRPHFDEQESVRIIAVEIIERVEQSAARAIADPHRATLIRYRLLRTLATLFGADDDR